MYRVITHCYIPAFKLISIANFVHIIGRFLGCLTSSNRTLNWKVYYLLAHITQIHPLVMSYNISFMFYSIIPLVCPTLQYTHYLLAMSHTTIYSLPIGHVPHYNIPFTNWPYPHTTIYPSPIGHTPHYNIPFTYWPYPTLQYTLYLLAMSHTLILLSSELPTECNSGHALKNCARIFLTTSNITSNMSNTK